MHSKFGSDALEARENIAPVAVRTADFNFLCWSVKSFAELRWFMRRSGIQLITAVNLEERLSCGNLVSNQWVTEFESRNDYYWFAVSAISSSVRHTKRITRVCVMWCTAHLCDAFGLLSFLPDQQISVSFCFSCWVTLLWLCGHCQWCAVKEY